MICTITKEQAYNELYEKALEINKQVKAMISVSDLENPVDVDLIKTVQSMFYEKAVEIFKRVNK